MLSRPASSVVAQSTGEPGRDSEGPNLLKNVYFGEEHMHTRNSFDAFTVGVNQTWDQAFEYAKGKEVTLSTSGQKIKKRTPYDFVAITDHAEYFGVLKEFGNADSPLSQSDFAKAIVAGTDQSCGRRRVTRQVARKSFRQRADPRVCNARAALFHVADIRGRRGQTL